MSCYSCYYVRQKRITVQTCMNCYNKGDMEDVCVRLPEEEAMARKQEILDAIYEVNGREEPVKHYMGVSI